MILLSFDIEEFDMPFEYGVPINFEDQVRISYDGTEKILALLKRHDIKATFFCTANFANHAPDLIRTIIADEHEVASHGYFHSHFQVEDLARSKKSLEEITGEQVHGFRMARMMPVDEKEIYKAGYNYNSSMNPTWIPGRYNNLSKPRRMFFKQHLLQIPASVSPMLRVPLFWLSFHNFPLALYKWLCTLTHRFDNYLNIYFHPWEFTDLRDKKKLGLPGFVSKNSGKNMVNRMESLIVHFKKRNMSFGTIRSFTALKMEVAE